MTEQPLLHRRVEPRRKGGLVNRQRVGGLVGATIGVVIGILAFDGRGAAILACTLAGAIAGILYGTLVGSFSGLESPEPGAEPSDTAHPLSEPAVDREHGSDAVRRDRDTDTPPD
jgi:hypothetical protein